MTHPWPTHDPPVTRPRLTHDSPSLPSYHWFPLRRVVPHYQVAAVTKNDTTRMVAAGELETPIVIEVCVCLGIGC